MNNDDRYKKSAIMKQLKRLKEGDPSNLVSINDFCWLLRQNGLLHNHGYFHYTTWGNLKKMLTSVDVGNKEKRRLFLMSASSSMNDTQEIKPGVYLASFSFGEEEDVAMWTNYGVPKHEAVRIKFPMRAMTRWIKENPCDRIVVYVQEGEDQPFHALDVKPAEIYFADVAYHGWNDLSPDSIRDAVRYNGEVFWFKEPKWRKCIGKTNDSLLFKKRGWAHEREVRLVVRFDDAGKMQNYTKIAIPFDSVYDAMLDAQDKKSVMYGPWYRENELKLDRIKGINAPCHSSFQGELRMRSNCDNCQNKKDPKKCKCPNAEWLLWK